MKCKVGNCDSDSTKGGSFFHFPAVHKQVLSEHKELLRKRRLAWYNVVKKGNPKLEESKLDNFRICHKHFVSGKPSNFRDVTDADWVPTLNLPSPAKKESPKSAHHHYGVLHRVKKRKLTFDDIDEDNDLSPPECSQDSEIPQEEYQTMSTQTISTQTEISIPPNYEKENHKLKEKINILILDEEAFKGDRNEKKLTYYTGLPNLALFLLILSRIDSYLHSIKVPNLSNFQKLLLVLMKLRLNLDYSDLGYRFETRIETISHVFKRVIVCLEYTFRYLIHWPDREEIQATMPSCFRLRFGNKVSVIIDCFEIMTQKPSLLQSKMQAYSQYKSRHTVKYLLGITPQGYISFLSCGYGGRASDKFITEDCGILENILPGDIILADRGFRIEESVCVLNAMLKVPNFVEKKKQMCPYKIENSREISSVRIHIERVIGSIRNKYRISQGPVPISLLNTEYDGTPFLDYVMRVCCIFVNLCDSIIDL